MTSNQDMKDASSTYNSFLTMLKWGCAVTAIFTTAVILVIS